MRGIFEEQSAVAEGQPPPGVAWEVDSVCVAYLYTECTWVQGVFRAV